MDSDLAYHRLRAVDELTLAMDAPSRAVADAHLQLSSMHFRRAEQLVCTGIKRPHLVLV